MSSRVEATVVTLTLTPPMRSASRIACGEREGRYEARYTVDLRDGQGEVAASCEKVLSVRARKGHETKSG